MPNITSVEQKHPMVRRARLVAGIAFLALPAIGFLWDVYIAVYPETPTNNMSMWIASLMCICGLGISPVRLLLRVALLPVALLTPWFVIVLVFLVNVYFVGFGVG